METTARSIASGDLAARVDETHVRDDELGSLAHAINGMAQELEDAQGHERAFLLSVSHDLRTPLTSIRGYAEAIEAWRTSCPRLPAWEDAVDEGLVRVMSGPSGRRSDATIELTPRGAALLASAEQQE